MPHHKSCKKRLITSGKRRDRNRINKATMRSALKKHRSLEPGSEERVGQVTDMYSRLDVLARKGVIPAKRASRLKSRLATQAVK